MRVSRRGAELSCACLLAATLGCGRTVSSSASLPSLDEGGEPIPSCPEDAGLEEAGLEILYSGPTPAVGYTTAIAVDTSNVYWLRVSTNTSPDAVMETSLCGRGTTVLASPPPPYEYLQDTLAVSSTDLYWVPLGMTNPTFPVFQVPLGGGSSKIVVPDRKCGPIALDASNLYWVDVSAIPDTVMKLPLTGGIPTPLSPPNDLYNMRLAVDATGVYSWAFGVGVERFSLDGGDPTLLAPDTNDFANDLIVHGGRVYWSTNSNDNGAPLTVTLATVATTGGPSTALSSDPGIFGIATDGTNVYWAEGSCDEDAGDLCTTGTVQKMPVDGGTPVTVVSGWPYSGLSAVAVDATSVYWTSGNSVMRWTPK